MMIEPTSKIETDGVDLWYIRIEEMDKTDGCYERCLKILSEHEQAKARQMKVRRAKKNFILSNYLKKSILSRYTSLAPEELKFTKGKHGKPYLANSDEVYFNISHTDEIIVIGVSRQELGLDIEYFGPKIKRAIIDIADRFFAPVEVADIQAAICQTQRFVEYWSLKEAFIKAIGKGLSVPLTDFWFEFNASDVDFFSKSSMLTGEGVYFFQSLELQNHALSVCLPNVSGKHDFKIIANKVTPWYSEENLPFAAHRQGYVVPRCDESRSLFGPEA